MKKKLVMILVSSLILFTGCSGGDKGNETTNASKKSNTTTETTTTNESNEIVLGSVSALSGNAAFLGTELIKGSKLVFDNINSQGGINGKKIRLVTQDDQYEPEKTVAETMKLLAKEKPLALFDYVGTPTSKVILPIVNDSKIPIVGLFTGAEFLRNPFQKYVFNIRASYYQEVQKIVDYWSENNRKKVAVFYQDDAFGLAVLSGTKIALSQYNSEPIALATYKRNKSIKDDQIAKIVEAKPDAVVMVGTYTQLSKFVASAKKSGLTDTQFHTVSFVGSEKFAKELQSHSPTTGENVFVTQVVPTPNDESLPLVKSFVADYKKAYSTDINYVALEGYLNAQVIVKALKEIKGEISRESLMASLEELTGYNPGIGKELEISNKNHQMINDVFVSKYENGNFVVFE